MGLIVLDAGPRIAVLDGDDTQHGAAIAALAGARGSGDPMVLPVSSYAELLVGPTRQGPEAVAVVDEFLIEIPIVVEALTSEISRIAARLRAGTSLRRPDAVVIATAIYVDSSELITTDRRWPSANSLGYGGVISVL